MRFGRGYGGEMHDGVVALHDADYLAQVGEIDNLRVPGLVAYDIGRVTIVTVILQVCDRGAADATFGAAD